MHFIMKLSLKIKKIFLKRKKGKNYLAFFMGEPQNLLSD